MKAINDTSLDEALDKLESIREIAEMWKEDSQDLMVKIIMSSILEVLDE